MALIIKRCKIYNDTYAKADVRVKKKMIEFIKLKSENPTTQFGSSDRHLNPPLKEYKHAKLTPDISIFYQTGSNELRLFGIFTHDDSGTGQPANQNKQNSLATKFGNQEFFESRR